jgi:hypothetical protein
MRLLVPRLLPVVAVLLLSPCLAKAATYYVASTGNDSNACTSNSAACRTIGHAAGLARSPGDIVQVAPGTYAENVKLSNSGAAGNVILLRGQDGSGCPTTAVSDVNHPTGTHPASKVTLKGTIAVSASHVSVDCILISHVGLSDGGSGIDFSTGVSNVVVTNFEIAGPELLSGRGSGIYFPGVGDVSSGSYVNNVTIANGYIHGVSSGWFGPCSSCNIHDNEIYNLTGDEPGSDHDYMDVWGIGTAIRHNYMHGNTINSCNGYDCHMDCIQTWNNTGDGTEVAKNITFDRNICFNHHEGVIAQDNSNTGDVANWTVTNNVFAYGPWDDGSGHPGPAGSAHPWCWVFENGNFGTSNKFMNNTCIDGTEGFRGNAGSAVYQDNLFFSAGTRTAMYDNSGAKVSGANNLYYATSGTFKSGTFPGDIINRNPQVVSIGTGGGTDRCIGCNFNIQSASAAKDAGVATGVGTDLLGTARPQGSADDIGAYEFLSTGQPAQPGPPTNLTGTVH